MPFLLNIKVDLIRESGSDDSYGGFSNVTGTVIHQDELSRIDSYMSNISLIKAMGLETEKVHTFFFHTHWQHVLDIREQDVVQIKWPIYHPDYLKRFRIRGVSREANHPGSPYGVVECTCIRIDRSRSNDSI